MKLERGENPCPYIGAMKADEKGKITIPPKNAIIAVAPLDVRNNVMKLSNVDKYSYKEIDGEVYRVQNGVVIGPPVSKKQFETIKKLHEATFGKDEDQR